MALTIGTAWLTWQAGKPLLRRPWLGALVLLAMPLLVRLSFTTLTETIAAFYLALATWLLVTGRPNRAALVFGMLPLTRHEGVVLVALLAGYLLLERRRVALGLLAAPLVVWNLLTWLIFSSWPAATWFAARPGGIAEYGSGSATFYVLRFVEACGLATLAAVLAGVAATWTERGVARDHRRLWSLVTVGAVSYFALQTWLYAVNTHASGGYARFLLPVAPWLALLAARGIEATTNASAVLKPIGFALALTLLALVLDKDLVHTLASRILDGPQLALADRAVDGAAVTAGALLVWALVAGALRLRRSTQAVVALVLLVQVVHLGASLRPFGLRPREFAVREAVSDARLTFGLEAELSGYSIWTSWFDRLQGDHTHYKPLAPGEIWTPVAGDVLIWDDRSGTALEAQLGPSRRLVSWTKSGGGLEHEHEHEHEHERAQPEAAVVVMD